MHVIGVQLRMCNSPNSAASLLAFENHVGVKFNA